MKELQTARNFSAAVNHGRHTHKTALMATGPTLRKSDDHNT